MVETPMPRLQMYRGNQFSMTSVSLSRKKLPWLKYKPFPTRANVYTICPALEDTTSLPWYEKVSKVQEGRGDNTHLINHPSKKGSRAFFGAGRGSNGDAPTASGQTHDVKPPAAMIAPINEASVLETGASGETLPLLFVVHTLVWSLASWALFRLPRPRFRTSMRGNSRAIELPVVRRLTDQMVVYVSKFARRLSLPPLLKDFTQYTAWELGNALEATGPLLDKAISRAHNAAHILRTERLMSLCTISQV